MSSEVFREHRDGDNGDTKSEEKSHAQTMHPYSVEVQPHSGDAYGDGARQARLYQEDTSRLPVSIIPANGLPP